MTQSSKVRKNSRGFLGLGLLLLGSCWFGCARFLNPPAEQRLFFPKDLGCQETVNKTFQCRLPEGGTIDGFLWVGEKLWFENQDTLVECAERLQWKK